MPDRAAVGALAAPVALLSEAPLPPTEQPLYASLLAWIEAALREQGHARPTCKRLALLVAGLLGGERGTPSAVAQAASRSASARPSRSRASPAAWPACSTIRSSTRPACCPSWPPRCCPPCSRTCAAPTTTRSAPRPGHAGHHARWIGVRLVVDETTHTDQTHVLVVGLAYRGAVLPLGVRTWPQTTALPERHLLARRGQPALGGAGALPPVLRAHVLLLADRGYGVPTLLDLLTAFGWHWVVRVQGQVRVRFPDGTERALRTLVPGPGTLWTGATAPPRPAGGGRRRPRPLGVFKRAGWRALARGRGLGRRASRALAAGHHLAPSAARLPDYAARWAIERLFLAWKSHGWDLEATALTAPPRLARLLTGYVVATWWLLAAALPVAQAHLAALARHADRPRPRRPVQLRLPLFPPSAPVRPPSAAC